MSNYSRYTRHPLTKRWEYALWMDDYYEHHYYGVRFPDGQVFDPWKERLDSGDLTKEEVDILNDHWLYDSPIF